MRRLVLGLGLLTLLSGTVAAAPGPSTEQRLQRLERRVERVTDLTLAVDSLRAENSRLQGRIETLEHQLELLKRKQRDIYLDVDQRISALQAGAASAAPVGAASVPAGDSKSAGGSAGGETAAGKPPATVASADPEQMQADYKAAYALLSPQARRYDEAAKAFSDFLTRYPQSPLAGNAQYWLGEAYYVSQKNEQALAAFEQLVKSYPDSAKVPGALYKIGRIRAASGDREKAILALKKVVTDYPTSPAAGLAREQLKKLQKSR